MSPLVEQLVLIVCPLVLGTTLLASARLLAVSTRATVYSYSLLTTLALVFASQLWNRYVFASPVDNRFALLWSPVSMSFWLIGPLTYLFILRRVSTLSGSYKDVLHALPYLLYSLYIYFDPIDQKIEWFVLIFSWNVVTLIYLVLCVQLLLGLKKRRDQSSSRPYNPVDLWSIVLVLGILFFVVADIVLATFMLNGSKIPTFALLGFELSRALVCLFLVVSFQFGNVGDKTMPGAELPRDAVTKQRSLRLEETTAKEVASLLEEKMTADLLFRQSDLNLRNLAEHMGVGTHELSEVLNSFMKTNFYSYVNEKRIAYAAQRLIAEPTVAIVDIAISCGYNNKTTFYTSFKKIMGSTPAEYRVHQRNNKKTSSLILS